VHGGFTLTEAAAVVPYLSRLGVGAVYTSPYFAAAPGSTHGYDVTNQNEINPEVGGRAAHTAFTDAVRAAGLQHVVDFVPNHMGISTLTNPWWRDVLRNGPSSRFANYFDIDWNPFKTELRRKLLLPILGDQYGAVLERGELTLEWRDSPWMEPGPPELILTYFDTRLPVNTSRIPPLADFVDRTPDERERILLKLNGVPGQPHTFDALHAVLEEQAYRLAYWRTAAHEINYRRFFDVNTLAGLRVEDPEVFAAIHRLLATLLREGRVTGVRIDHPDGLFDPAKYFDMLQDLAADAGGEVRRPGCRPVFVVAEKILSGRERLPRSWGVHGTTGYNFLHQVNGLFVDPANARRVRRAYAKLTGDTESFDDLLYETKRLIMDTSMASELTVLAHMLDRIGENNRKSRDFTLNSLRDALVEVVACFPVYRTYVDVRGWAPDDRAQIERAIGRARRRNPAMDPTIFDFFREIVLPRDPEDASPSALRTGAGAVEPQGRGPVLRYDRRGGYPPADAAEAAERRQFAMKFQQYTGPLQAKGLEDTAFYRYNVLLSLNEVGGDPSRFGTFAADFHDMNRLRRDEWPYEMLATSTHDTKLGEDIRTRIDVLSEIPEEWEREASRWMRLNKNARTLVDGEPAPNRNDEYRFYQVLIGAWPGGTDVPQPFVERMQAYMVKSIKEAKLHSSWINPFEPYESAASAFVQRVLCGREAVKFLPAFLPLQQRVARYGMINSLAQTVLKIASPGVPDFYQGSEIWDLNLVDPDNRRPVDFEERARRLDGVDGILALDAGERRASLARVLCGWEDGTIKLLVTAAGLRLRAADPRLFLDGDYLPLATETTVPGRAIAFARTLAEAGTGSGRVAIVIAPHLAAHVANGDRRFPLGDAWKTSRVHLPPSLAGLTYRDVFTGTEIRAARSETNAWLFIGQVLHTLPVALLIGEAPG
jgi:(1->4)-alpha-D-glucan 1-alpha-D-glucosylmutase